MVSLYKRPWPLGLTPAQKFRAAERNAPEFDPAGERALYARLGYVRDTQAAA